MGSIKDYVNVQKDMNELLNDLRTACGEESVEALDELFLIKLLKTKSLLEISVEDCETEDEKVKTVMIALLSLCVHAKIHFGLEIFAGGLIDA